MIARIVCLFAGHEYTTIAWHHRSKGWREKECLRCGKRKSNADYPPRPLPLRVVK